MIRKIEDVKIHKNNYLKIEKKIEKKEELFLNKLNQNKDNKDYPVFSNTKIKNNKFNKIKFFSFIIFIILSLYFIFNFFENTKILIENKKEQIELNYKEFQAVKTGSIDLPFEIMILDSVDEKQINLKNKKDVSLKSTGNVTIYNQYSKTPEKIISGAHITSSDGKLYILDKTVEVPGYTLDKDGKIVPGSVVASVASFLPGELYNISPTSFIFNSFKNTSKENTIYAKSSEEFSGGALGDVYFLTTENMPELNSYAENTVKNILIRKVKAELPEGYTFYKEGVNFNYKINENFLSKEENSLIPIKSQIIVVIFKTSYLSESLIKKLYPKIDNLEMKEIEIKNLNELEFSFKNKDLFLSKDILDFEFFLNGEIDLVWNPDTSLLSYNLKGIHKSWANDIFSKDEGIKNAVVKIFPPWKNYLPMDVSKIKIEVK